MIILEEEKEVIINFIIDSIKTFKAQEGEFNSIGIYCCPWAGWISISFNVNKSLMDTSNNCPDFEFVEFKFLDLKRWQEEYENETPTYKFEGETLNFNYELGDEVLNKLFFKFLSAIIPDVRNDFKENILLQMLDSKFYEIF